MESVSPWMALVIGSGLGAFVTGLMTWANEVVRERGHCRRHRREQALAAAEREHERALELARAYMAAGRQAPGVLPVDTYYVHFFALLDAVDRGSLKPGKIAPMLRAIRAKSAEAGNAATDQRNA